MEPACSFHTKRSVADNSVEVPIENRSSTFIQREVIALSLIKEAAAAK